MNSKLNKQGIVSSAFLKNIAYVTMFIDHFFAIVFKTYINVYTSQGVNMDEANDIYDIGRAVGRISFVLFAFMMAEGFKYTRNTRNYLLRLGLFAFISEIPFDLAFYGKIFYVSKQNIFFTLYLGVLALCLIKKFEGELFIQINCVILCCMAAAVLKTDYMFMGVLLIVAFYICRSSFWYQFIVGSAAIYFGIIMVYVVRYWERGYALKTYLKLGISELYGIFAFCFIYFYNGKKGRQLPKACYYLFYPLHLLLLFYIQKTLFGQS